MIDDLKSSIFKQWLVNFQCATNAWKHFVRYNLQKTQKKIFDKGTLKNLAAIRTTSIDIVKIFNVRRSVEARWINENELENVLEEPANDVIINA